MEKLKDIWMRLSAFPPIRTGLDALGMKVIPFYLFVEKRAFVDLSHLDEKFGAYEACLLGPEDMPAVANMPGRKLPELVFRERLQAGNLCFGMKHQGELVAFTWADMKQCKTVLYSFPLKPNEAYLFDAFTRQSHRGRGIAPYIRWCTYKELEKQDKINLFSYSLYTNEPAVRFKKKLNARIVGLRLCIRFLNRFHFSLPLKKFRENAC